LVIIHGSTEETYRPPNGGTKAELAGRIENVPSLLERLWYWPLLKPSERASDDCSDEQPQEGEVTNYVSVMPKHKNPF